MTNGNGTGLQFISQVLRGPWFMAFSALVVMSMQGSIYMFGSYTNEIKLTLGYDQTTLNLLSFFKNVGAAVGVPAGLLMEIAPPWVVQSLGAVLNFFGYFMIWLSVTKRVPKPAVWQICFYMCVGAQSQTFADTSALVTCVKNFPKSRGVVLGLLTGYVGLSGAIITQLYYAIYGNNNPAALILLLAWLPSAVFIAFLCPIRYLKVVGQKDDERKVFYKMICASLILAGFIMVITIVEKDVSFTQYQFIGIGVVTLILLFLPVLIVIKEEYSLCKNSEEEFSVPRNDVVSNTSGQIALATRMLSPVEDKSLSPPSTTEMLRKNGDSFLQNMFCAPKRGEDYTIFQALVSIDMIILLISQLSGFGGTLTAMDNLGQIGISLGYPTRSVNTFVSVVCIWNYLGRIVAGFISEHCLIKYKLPRPLMLTSTLLLSCVGYLLIAFNVPNGLYVASAIIGFCFGAEASLVFSIISELFGLKHYATLYSFGPMAAPVAVYFLNVQLTGNLYDKEARRQMDNSGWHGKVREDLQCRGPKCFRLAFCVITALTLFSVVVSLLLVVRTREFYKGDIYKKFEEVIQETTDNSIDGSDPATDIEKLGQNKESYI